MLICGDENKHGCDQGTHIACLQPPLPEVPKGNWFCKTCTTILTGGSVTGGRGNHADPVADDTRLEDEVVKRSRTRSQTMLDQDIASQWGVEKIVQMRTDFPVVRR
jgi:hypothetical protein